MTLAIVNSRAGIGTDAPEVKVEVHLARGLPKCVIVGLAATAVRESLSRVQGAITNAGFDFPRQRITVNLAPADLPKDGGRFDLPIAIGILVASRQVRCKDLGRMVFLGELALSGELKPVRGPLITALALRGSNATLVLPTDSAREAALIDDIDIRQTDSLHDLCAALNGLDELESPAPAVRAEPPPMPDFSEVVGHAFARRAMEVAASGQHSLLITGPPGAGKTMLASRLGSILPAASEQESLEIAAIASLSRSGFDASTWGQRPFRAPHHSASGAAIIGGGREPAPGEVSLAHNGVLFLDELPEFQRGVLELLREPLEAGEVHISRAARQARFMARFLLVAAANPCPCGFLGDSTRCHCLPEQVARYQTRLSGPLLDRIDMHLSIQALSPSEMFGGAGSAEPSAKIQTRVERARQIQMERQGRPNGALDSASVATFCRLNEQQMQLLAEVIERAGLSARGCHRILRLARTVADLSGHRDIQDNDLLEAIKLRGATRLQQEKVY